MTYKYANVNTGSKTPIYTYGRRQGLLLCPKARVHARSRETLSSMAVLAKFERPRKMQLIYFPLQFTFTFLQGCVTRGAFSTEHRSIAHFWHLGGFGGAY